MPLSLRMFAGLAVILAGVSAWRIAIGYRQLLAIREVERLGGSVRSEPVGPTWLRDRLGADRMRLFDKVVSVDLGGQSTDDTLRLLGRMPSLKSLDVVACPHITGAGLAHLEALTNLEMLLLNGLNVTDVDLIHLHGLVKLKKLFLTRMHLTDAGLVHLKRLKALELLDLSVTQITDSGLAELSGLTNLSWLSLTNTRVTDDGLAKLDGLTKLVTLWLDGTKVTGAGLAPLSGLPKLRQLALHHTCVTDLGIAHLASLTHLERLHLDYAEVTDSGLMQLKSLRELSYLSVDRTHVTRAGVAELRLFLPQLTIIRSRTFTGETDDGTSEEVTARIPATSARPDEAADDAMQTMVVGGPAAETPPESALLTAGNSHESARLRGISARGIVLDERLDRLFAGSDLSRADLAQAILHGGSSAFQRVRFAGANLAGASLMGDGASFQAASFGDADLTASRVTGGAASFQGASFEGANLADARLSGGAASFQQASFARANLRGAILVGQGSALQLATFEDADLTNAQIVCDESGFQSAAISGTRFQMADLSAIDRQSLATCTFAASRPPEYDEKSRFPKEFDPVKRGWKLAP
jgi:uncharacterized protein YjbI with pentapeptide repeats